MGVTFDIIGSILVRTAIVLIVLRMNISLNTMVSESMAHTNIQQELSILRDIMTSDFEYVGLGLAKGTGVKECTSSKFKFDADLAADGSIETVSYYYGDTDELANTPNPNDRKLYRQIGSGTPLNVANGITKCVFTYYKQDGNPTTDKAQVASFLLTLTLEEGTFSTQVKKSDGTYINKYPASYWEQTFFPPNL